MVEQLVAVVAMTTSSSFSWCVAVVAISAIFFLGFSS